MFYLYELICPLKGEICYVGLSINPENRLKQHIYDCYKYNTKIAKYVRHLRKLDLHKQLRMQIIKSYDTKEEAGEAEKQRIKLRRLLGKIYNQLDGGYDQAPHYNRESLQKLKDEGRLFGGIRRGEDGNTAILKEEDVLLIYKLVKGFYSTSQIRKILDNRVSVSTVTAIVRGVNWSHLWKDNFDSPIYVPSVLSEWLTPRDKVYIIKKILNGDSFEMVQPRYPQLQKGDYNKVVQGTIWKKVSQFVQDHPDLAEDIFHEIEQTP